MTDHVQKELDDIIQNDFDYSWEEDEYYQVPLKVVEVK